MNKNNNIKNILTLIKKRKQDCFQFRDFCDEKTHFPNPKQQQQQQQKIQIKTPKRNCYC